jgi:pilus assembly protein FimV
MFKRNLYPVLLLALLSPAATLALGLGDIHLKSSLNAPLDADIDLVGASADDLSSVKASLAGREAFARSGLDYPAFLGTVTFTPEKMADGRTVIHVRSRDVANEPFATLLVEVDWARGHVVREYTVLLDPPVFSADNATNTAVAAPAVASTARSGTIERPAAPASPAPAVGAATTAAPSPAPAVASSPPTTATVPAAAAAATSGNASRSSATPGSYTVRPGDTLYSVATQAYGAGNRSARQRELVGIYRANPAAFEGNMNLLRSGSRLSLPGDEAIAAISPAEASAEVRQQYADWNANRGAAASSARGGSANGQLRLVTPKESAQSPGNAAAGSAAAPARPPTGSSPAAASAPATAALTDRVQQLEAQLAESQRLLQLRSTELAALQARARQAANAPPTAATTAPAAATPAAPAPAAQTPAPAAPTPAPAASPPPSTATPPVLAAKPKPAAAPAAESGNSILDLIEEYWYVPAGLLAVLIILLVIRFVRARQEDEFDRSLGRLQPNFDAGSTATLRAADTVPVRTLADPQREGSYRVEESGTHEQPMIETAAASADRKAATGEHVAIDDTVTGEHPVALDQGDPLAEADFHMAYGLYDQAADLVQIAISREPNRRDLKLKLLEVFFVWGNKDRFLQSARELASSRGQALAGEWEKIVIMGRQIAPEDPLFANAGTLTGAASGGVDLNLEGGQNRVDFDLLGEPTVVGGDAGAGLDLDLGAALRDVDPTGEAHKLGGDSGVDFVLDDPERGNDATGSTREMPASADPSGRATSGTATVKVVTAADAEAPTVEQPHLRQDDNATIRQKIDAAGRGVPSTSDQTAELALDDLGLDLGGLEGADDDDGLPTGGTEEVTLLAGLGDDTRAMLAHEEAAAAREKKAGASPAPAEGLSSESGTWLFTDTDFSAAVEDEANAHAPTEVVTQISPPPHDFETGSTSRLAQLDPNDIDLDLGNLGGDTGVNGVDLDVGSAAVSEGTFVQTQKIAADEIPLPDLEPATMSEVGTKLDLARAYMDMGDPEGARSILSEVLTEGSVSQKQEARRLMDTLPG